MATVIGRERELGAIEAAFTARTTKKVPVCVLTGMGGVGKTSLARAYAQRHLDDYGIVWWIRAEDRAVVDLEYRGLLEIVLSSGEATQIRDAVAAACAWLGTCRYRWLLILDNVQDAQSLQGLIPAKGNGNVVVTTRSSRWTDHSNLLPVDKLDRESAIDLLMRRSPDQDEATAKELAEELGDLPLALTQAASFVQAHAVDLATYMRLYRESAAELLGGSPPEDYSHTVATTWQVAIDRLPASARNLLNLLVYLAPDSIPVSLFMSGEIPLLPDELAVRRAVGELLSHSLVSRGAPGTSPCIA
jgi:AAA ATPase domain